MPAKWKKAKKQNKMVYLTAAVLTIMTLCFPLLAETETILSFEAGEPVAELTVAAGAEEPNLPDTLRAVVALGLEDEELAEEQTQPSYTPATVTEPAEQQAGEQSEPAELEESDQESVESTESEESDRESAESLELAEPDSEPVESLELAEPDSEPAESSGSEESDHEPVKSLELAEPDSKPAESSGPEESDHEPVESSGPGEPNNETVSSAEPESAPSIELVKAASSQVRLMSIHVGQTIISQSQQFFVPAEPDDAYGYQPADGGLYTYLDEYRTYGSLNGAAPVWYACDENGNVTGVVMEIPVTWTSDDYDKDTPGTYTFTAQFSDYSYAGEPLYALVTVAEDETTMFPSVGGLVWLDKNNDGIRDVGETGIDGFPVVLYAADNLNTVVQATTTEADGTYRFAGMMPGSYVVSVTSEIIGEAEYLMPLVITNDNCFEVDEEAAASWSVPLELAEDTAVSGIDAGMRLPMSIQLLDGVHVQVSNFEDLRDLVWPFLSDGDTIELANDIEFTSTLTVTKNITIIAAPETSSVTLTSTGWRHFIISGNNVTLALDNVVLDGGGTAGGIDLETGTSLMLQGVRIQDCRAPGYYGGGIFAKGNNTVLLGGSEISGCAANYGGGIFIRSNGYLTVTNGSKIDGNYSFITGTVGGSGGGISAAYSSTVVISEDSEVSNNRASGIGGAISLQSSSSLRVTSGSKISGNTVTTSVIGVSGGGGIYSDDLTKLSVSASVTFSGNTASMAAEPLPNMTANYPQIATVSSSIYDHPLNNYDIYVLTVTVHYVDRNGNPVGGLSPVGYAAVRSAVFTLPPQNIPSVPGYVYTGWQKGTDGEQQSSEVPVTLPNVTANTFIYLRYARVNNVTVSSLVSGDYADKTKDFIFTIYFVDGSGAPLTGTFAYTGGAVAGSGATAPTSGTLILGPSGATGFTLRHGQQITIADVPDGKVWMEVNSELGYIATWRDGDLPPSLPSLTTGELTMSGTDRTITCIETYHDIVPTGIRADGTGAALLLLALLAGASVILLAGGLIRRKRKKGVMN